MREGEKRWLGQEWSGALAIVLPTVRCHRARRAATPMPPPPLPSPPECRSEKATPGTRPRPKELLLLRCLSTASCSAAFTQDVFRMIDVGAPPMAPPPPLPATIVWLAPMKLELDELELLGKLSLLFRRLRSPPPPPPLPDPPALTTRPPPAESPPPSPSPLPSPGTYDGRCVTGGGG